MALVHHLCLSLETSVLLIHYLLVLQHLNIVFISGVSNAHVIGHVARVVDMLEVPGKTRLCKVLAQVLMLALGAGHYDRVIATFWLCQAVADFLVELGTENETFAAQLVTIDVYGICSLADITQRVPAVAAGLLAKRLLHLLLIYRLISGRQRMLRQIELTLLRLTFALNQRRVFGNHTQRFLIVEGDGAAGEAGIILLDDAEVALTCTSLV